MQYWFYILFFSSATIYSQCLDINGIGGFEGGDTNSWSVINPTNGVANFVTNPNQTFFGDGFFNAEISSNADNNPLTLFQKDSCNLNFVSGESYNVSFYMKGTPGQTINVMLLDGTNLIETKAVDVKINEFTFYSVNFNSTITTAQGKIAFQFPQEGIYALDEIVFRDTAVNFWHVSSSSGDDTNSGLSPSSPFATIQKAINSWSTGDIIYIMDGVYRNANFGTGNKDNLAVLNITTAGTRNGPLVLTNYPNHHPKIQFDGIAGIRLQTAQHIEISGLEIEGINQNISLAEAENNRLNNLRYYLGRGIVSFPGFHHHITIHSNKIHDTPAAGIRITYADYVILSNNEVYNCTWWGNTGSSGIDIGFSRREDDQLRIKMRMTYNKSYNNRNRIRFYQGCTGTGYGCVDYPDIKDGQGVYITTNNSKPSQPILQQNPNGQYIGYFYLANNLSYQNGINGLVVHQSDNSIVVNNTIYNNGTTPLSEGRQSSAGITVNSSVNVRFYNNISQTLSSTDNTYQVYGSANSGNIMGLSNVSFNGVDNMPQLDGTVAVDPFFNDVNNFDFSLDTNSTLIDSGVNTQSSAFLSQLLTNTTSQDYIPQFDIIGEPRYVTQTDIGAYENNSSISNPVVIDGVGIGTTNPQGVLDIHSDHSGIVFPRVSNTSSVLEPKNGMIIYDTSSSCFRGYQNGNWSNCF